MRNRNRIIILRPILLILALLILPAYQGQVEKSQNIKVQNLESVIDGSSFIANGQIVKLWGITTINHDSPYAYASRMYLETILNEGPFHCEPKDNMHNFKLMTCFSQGVDIARMLLSQGMAVADKKISHDPYLQLEDEARKSNLGVWKN